MVLMEEGNQHRKRMRFTTAPLLTWIFSVIDRLAATRVCPAQFLSHKYSIGIDVLTPRAFLAREGEDT
jgi:hypothetical protein